MKTIKTCIAAMIVAASIAPFAAMAHQAGMHANRALGSEAPEQASTRTIVITPASRAINVNNGEVVTLEVGGKSFTWKFDTLRDSDRFALADIAPEGIDTHDLWVYVAPNPIYAE